MNNTFYKILKFEVKQNYIHWIISLLTFVSVATFFTLKGYLNHQPFILKGSFVPLLLLFSALITLHSYSESTSRQSMIMYHLLPVSRNSKFFTKQLITFIAAPLLLLAYYLFLALIINPLVSGEFNQSVLSPNFKPIKIASLFLWSHSLATFFAIVFKKRKLLYVVVSFFAFQFSMVIVFLIWKAVFNATDIPPIAITGNYISGLPIPVGLIVPPILYIISYRLFFKRQL